MVAADAQTAMVIAPGRLYAPRIWNGDCAKKFKYVERTGC